jgi:hypothetical protein
MAHKLTRKERSIITKFKKVWDETANYTIRHTPYAGSRKWLNEQKRATVKAMRNEGT